jgi:hypothetical protein
MPSPALNFSASARLASVLRTSALRYVALCLLVLLPQLAAAQDAAAVPAEAPPAPTDAPPPPLANGPFIEMPAELSPLPPTAADVPSSSLHFGVSPGDSALTRGLAPMRLSQEGTVVGGYGQFTLNALKPGDAKEFNVNASVRRLVLFVAHAITDDIRIYTEFEWENAVSCSSCVGSAEVEQAFLQWRLHGDELALRAGLLLIPMGVINEWHEPPVFHGVERPFVDQLIIPSTWRELGGGFSGTVAQILRYQLYFTTTLNPLRLSEQGLAGGRALGASAPGKAWAVAGRAEIEPVLGVIGGVSFFGSDLGPNADYYREDGRQRHLKLPLLGYSIDARMRRWGIEARIVWAQFFLPNSGDLVAAFRSDGSPLFPAEATEGTVPTRLQGGYIEAAFDVFSPFHLSHELLPFIRLETYDTQAAVPKGFKRNPQLDINELTMGLTYRPLAQLAFKWDLQLRDRRLGYDQLQWNLGFGYMF